MLKILFLVLMGVSSALAEQTLQCHNENILKTPITLVNTNDGKWLLQDFLKQSCEFVQEEFNPTNDNYKNWIKLVPTESEVSLCSDLKGLFPVKSREIYQILIGTEVQKKLNGFIQIDFESQGNIYGPKKIKTFLNCVSY